VFSAGEILKKRSYTIIGRPEYCGTTRGNPWILLVVVKTVHVSSSTQPAWLPFNDSGRCSIWQPLRRYEEKTYALCVRSVATVVIDGPLGCAGMRFTPVRQSSSSHLPRIIRTFARAPSSSWLLLCDKGGEGMCVYVCNNTFHRAEAKKVRRAMPSPAKTAELLGDAAARCSATEFLGKARGIHLKLLSASRRHF